METYLHDLNSCENVGFEQRTIQTYNRGYYFIRYGYRPLNNKTEMHLKGDTALHKDAYLIISNDYVMHNLEQMQINTPSPS